MGGERTLADVLGQSSIARVNGVTGNRFRFISPDARGAAKFKARGSRVCRGAHEPDSGFRWWLGVLASGIDKSVNWWIANEHY